MRHRNQQAVPVKVSFQQPPPLLTGTQEDGLTGTQELLRGPSAAVQVILKIIFTVLDESQALVGPCNFFFFF